MDNESSTGRPSVRAAARVRVRTPPLARWLGRLARWCLVGMAITTIMLLFLPRPERDATPEGLFFILTVGGLMGGLIGSPLLALLALFWRWIRWISLQRTVVGSAEKVTLEGWGAPWIIARDTIRDGLLVPGEAGRVDLNLRNKSTISLTFEDPGSGPELLRILGLDPTRQRVTLKLGYLFTKIMIGFGTAIVGLMVLSVVIPLVIRLFDLEKGGLYVLIQPLVILATWAAVVYFGNWWVTVGSDGVEVKRAFKRHFVPLNELQSIEVSGNILMLHKKKGDSVLVTTGAAQAGAVAARIREVMNIAAESAGQTPSLDVLDRAGRSLSSWRHDLAELAQAQSSYRQQSIEPQHIKPVLVDAKAPTERRLAAAMVLLAANVPGAEEQIRTTAKTSADRALRKALEALAEGEADDDVLQEALVS